MNNELLNAVFFLGVVFAVAGVVGYLIGYRSGRLREITRTGTVHVRGFNYRLHSNDDEEAEK